MGAPSVTAIRGVITASVISTAIHFTDNFIYVDDYPQPDYINREFVLFAWVFFTLVGVAAYLFYRDGKTTAAGVYTLIYSYTGLSSLGHYFFGSFGEFTTKMHVLIWMDGITGTVVALCGLWILVGSRHQRRNVPVASRPA